MFLSGSYILDTKLFSAKGGSKLASNTTGACSLEFTLELAASVLLFNML